MSRNLQMDAACNNLRRLIMNPYAIARFLEKPKQVEEQWKELAKRRGVKYAH